MTTEEFLRQQDAKFRAIIEKNIPLQITVRSIMALQSRRIFLEGKNTSGSLIGNYSTKPIYVSGSLSEKSNLPTFPLAGKYGETKFKNGTIHRSGYFGNYLAFKRAINLNKRIGTVDLFLTGTLHRHWANNDTVGKADARKGKAKARKINQHRYIVAISESDVKKIERYGNVFGLSLQERKLFFTVLQKEFNKAMK